MKNELSPPSLSYSSRTKGQRQRGRGGERRGRSRYRATVTIRLSCRRKRSAPPTSREGLSAPREQEKLRTERVRGGALPLPPSPAEQPAFLSFSSAIDVDHPADPRDFGRFSSVKEESHAYCMTETQPRCYRTGETEQHRSTHRAHRGT